MLDNFQGASCRSDESKISTIALSAEEIYELTRYKRPAEQMRVLGDLGIRARRLHDNTVRVLRRDLDSTEENLNKKNKVRPKLIL